jgi:hypothetical protein
MKGRKDTVTVTFSKEYRRANLSNEDINKCETLPLNTNDVLQPLNDEPISMFVPSKASNFKYASYVKEEEKKMTTIKLDTIHSVNSKLRRTLKRASIDKRRTNASKKYKHHKNHTKRSSTINKFLHDEYHLSSASRLRSVVLSKESRGSKKSRVATSSQLGHETVNLFTISAKNDL